MKHSLLEMPGRSGRRVVAGLLAPLVAATGAVALASPATAALSAVGAVDPGTGFPVSYTDSAGLGLQLCLDGPPLCVAAAADLAPPAGEAFYALADATAGPFQLREAVEAAYLSGTRVTFMRTQISDTKTALQPNTNYTYTDPYGSDVCTTNASGFIPRNGCRTETVPGGAPFTAAMAGRIDPFLTWDTFGSATGAPPPGYIGDGVTPHLVQGSPTGFNGFRVTGPGLTGTCAGGTIASCVETDQFTIQGKVQPGGALASLSGGPLAFGDVAATPVTKTLTYTNLGTTPVTVSGMSVTGTGAAAFSVQNNCGALPATVAVGTACTIGVTFTPDPGKGSSATLTVTDDTPVATRTVPLSGSNLPNMVVAAPIPPAGVDFGSLTVGTTSPEHLVTIGNDGKGPLTGVTGSIAGFNADQYKLGATNTCLGATVAPQTSCRIGVQFAPTFNGSAGSTNLRVADASGKVVTVPLNGSGVVGTTATVPGAPTIGTAVAGNAQATVSWTAPGSDGGAPITEYRIQVRTGTTVVRTVTGIQPAAGAANGSVVTGLTNGTAYNFRVRAVNRVGLGTLSVASNAVTPAGATTTVPGRPVAPVATTGAAGGALTASASWAAPADTGGTAITGYVVRALRMSATGTVLATTVFNNLPASPLNLTMTLPAGSYRFTVQARNSVGVSLQSPRSNLVAAQ